VPIEKVGGDDKGIRYKWKTYEAENTELYFRSEWSQAESAVPPHRVQCPYAFSWIRSPQCHA